MISLIHPSRQRPAKAFKTGKNWLERQSGKHEIEYICSIDYSDPDKAVYEELFKDVLIINDNDCVVQAANKAAQACKGDIIIYLSDDFNCPFNWDDLIVQKVGDTKKALLKVDDKLQPFQNQVLTIPIMTRELYEHLGYFFYPEYKSMWVDVDLFWRCKEYIIDCHELVFIHEHHSKSGLPGNQHFLTNDETYRASEKNWKQGLDLYNRRAAEFGWPIKLR